MAPVFPPNDALSKEWSIDPKVGPLMGRCSNVMCIGRFTIAAILPVITLLPTIRKGCDEVFVGD